MALKDEIRAERQAFLKNATRKQKLEYFWGYYKIPVLITVCIVIFVSNFVYHKITDPEIILNGLFLNTFHREAEISLDDYEQLFFEDCGIDTAEYVANFNANYNLVGDDASDYEALQALFVQLGAGAVDFMVSPVNYAIDYAYNEFFVDLRTVLSEEQLTSYSDYLMYIDGAVVEEIEILSQDIDNEIAVELPDPYKPDEMKDPIPVFVDLAQCKKLEEHYSSETEKPVFALLANAENPELSLKFIDYLMEEK